jgi:hypothetical protein
MSGSHTKVGALGERHVRQFNKPRIAEAKRDYALLAAWEYIDQALPTDDDRRHLIAAVVEWAHAAGRVKP